MTLAVGDRAPDFTLPCSSGGTVTLSDVLKSKRAVVLFFYPKDHTAGCTAEACGFRDDYEGFAEAGAEVLGISSDSVESHRRFSAKHKLPMRLLTDADGAVRRAYGVRPTLGIIPGRATFIVDAQGVVRHVYSSLVRVASHVQQALTVVRQLASGAA
jgi:thioredoxin-dependent peroxiredoxin